MAPRFEQSKGRLAFTNRFSDMFSTNVSDKRQFVQSLRCEQTVIHAEYMDDITVRTRRGLWDES